MPGKCGCGEFHGFLSFLFWGCSLCMQFLCALGLFFLSERGSQDENHPVYYVQNE